MFSWTFIATSRIAFKHDSATPQGSTGHSTTYDAYILKHEVATFISY